MTVVGTHLDGIDVVTIGIGRGFEIRTNNEPQRARIGVNREFRSVGTANDRESREVAFRTGRHHAQYGRLIFCHCCRGRRGNDRGFVNVGNGDDNVLGNRAGAVAHAHVNVVDVVGAGICRVFEIWRSHETQRASRGIDREQCTISATDQ